MFPARAARQAMRDHGIARRRLLRSILRFEVECETAAAATQEFLDQQQTFDADRHSRQSALLRLIALALLGSFQARKSGGRNGEED
ncbi:MAG: hypothetical protein ACRDL7_00240, partial [Gaiellaceae bacterium]